MSSNLQTSTIQKPLFRLSLFSFETAKASINYHLQKLSPPQKIIVFSVSAGVVLVSLVARYFRRKRVRKSALVNPKENAKYRKNKPLVIKSPSGEFHTLGGTVSPGFHRSSYRHSSISAGSDRVSLASGIPGTIISQSGKSSELAPQQYGVMGSGHGLALPSQEAAEFTESLQKVIDNAYSLQDQCEHLFLHEHSVLFRSADISPNLSEAGYGDRRTLTSFSSLESFVSAQGDIADLRNLEEFEENPPTLYLSALKHHEEYGIPFRDVRTDRVKCGSDVEYICKVHCLRLASQYIFSFPTNKEWFAEAGRQVIECLLLRADKTQKIAYVLTMIFFYILWNALATAIWSVLKAKRRVLKYQDGFVSHFYDVSEHLSPVLIWGFLGPDHRLREVCSFFKDQIQGMLQDMFSFSTVRYTSVEELSEDLLKIAKDRHDVLIEKLTLPLVPNGTINSDGSYF
ncbi:Mitoguardin [Armadillidium vulgare]|nr:Mitoguardin [Armadillidium vulgare]